MAQTRSSDFRDRLGEALLRALMLGLLVVTGTLLLPIAAPLIAFWLIYFVVKPRPHEAQPEYKIVE